MLNIVEVVVDKKSPTKDVETQINHIISQRKLHNKDKVSIRTNGNRTTYNVSIANNRLELNSCTN